MAFNTLTIDLNVAIAKFESDLKQAVRSSKESSDQISKALGFAKTALSALGIGLGIREIISQFNDVTQSILDIGKASEKTGIAIESLSGLKLAAESVEIPFEALVAGLNKFDKALDTTNPALLRLGFSLAQIQAFAQDPAAALSAIADKFAGMQDSAGKAAIAVQLFGKAGAELIPFLNQGSKGFAEFQAQAQRLGLVVTSDTLAAFKKFDDQMDSLKAAFDGFKIAVVGGALPALTSFISEINEGIRIFGSFGSALYNIGLGISGFKSAGENATKLRNDLSELRAELESFKGDNTAHSREAITQVEADIEVTKKRLEYVLFVQRQLALVGTQTGAVLDSLDARAKQVTKLLPAPGQLAGQSSGAIIKANLAAAIALEKESASEKQTILDAAHAQGLISEASFYASRTNIARKELGAELAAVKEAIAERVRLNSTAATPEERDAGQADLIRLSSQRVVLEKQIAFASVKGKLEETAAVKTLLDATAQYNIELLVSQGRTAEAAIAEQSLNKALDERAKIVANFGEKSPDVEALDASRAREVSQKRLNDLGAEANAIRDNELAKEVDIQTVLELSGHTVEAELKAIEATNEARKATIEPLTKILALQAAIAEGLGNKALAAQLHLQAAELNANVAALDPMAVATKRFAVVQTEVTTATREAGIEEQHLQNLRSTGAIGSLELLADTDEARKREVARLTEIRDRLQQIAIATKDEKALLAVRELDSEIETLAANANQAGQVFENVFEDSFSNAFVGFIDRSKNASEAWDSFVGSVVQGLNRIAAQAIAQQIFGGVTGSGGFLAGLGSLFASSSGGGGAGAGFSGSMAEGGITSGRTLAGESGPEAVIPLSGGRSVPVTLKGGGNVTVNMTVVTPDVASFRKSSLQITNQLNAQLARGRQRA